MKVMVLVLLVFLLSSCAHDSYTVIPNSSGSQKNMATDLYNCKIKVVHEYYAGQSLTGGGQVVGMVASGVLGGAIGGAAFGAVVGQNEEQGSMKRSEMNPHVEKCMEEHGYAGTSN
jgi:hypothetical protein